MRLSTTDLDFGGHPDLVSDPGFLKEFSAAEYEHCWIILERNGIGQGLRSSGAFSLLFILLSSRISVSPS